MRWRGHDVETACAREGRLPPPQDYDAVVLGSDVAFGHHSHKILDYIREHRAELAQKPSAFFSVNLAAAIPFAGSDPRGHLRHTFDALGWTPDHSAAFGALGTPQVDRLADRFAVSLPEIGELAECSAEFGPMS